MNVETKILINQYAQNIVPINEVYNSFQEKSIPQKRKFLEDIIFLMLQMKIQPEDVDKAIEISNLKSTFTPIIKIKKGVNQNSLREIINLPDYELNKVFILFLSLYKTSYDRMWQVSDKNPNKWWFQDLSNSSYVEKLKNLNNIQIILRKLVNNDVEIGTIITANLQFSISIFEKEQVENYLIHYAFTKLYPNKGLSLYREIHNDTCAITVILNINELPYYEDKISIV